MFYTVNYYKMVEGLGWTFQTKKFDDESYSANYSMLINQQKKGTVRNIDVIKVRIK